MTTICAVGVGMVLGVVVLAITAAVLIEFVDYGG